MQGQYVVVLLAFVVGSQTVLAQDLGTCMNSLLKSIDAGTDKCTAWKEYLNCSLWRTNADTTFTTDEEIRALQTTVQNEMYKQGVYCSISVRDILSEIKQERRNGVTRSTVRPLDSQTVLAQNRGTCMSSMIKSIVAGTDECTAWKVNINCYLWRLNADTTFTTDEQIQALQTAVQYEMYAIMPYCSINVRDILSEIKQERKNGVTRTTTRPIGFNESTSAAECSSAIVFVMQENERMSCDVFTSFVKCIIRVKNLYYRPSESMYQSLDSVMRDQMSKLSTYCVLDARSIIEEVARENGNTTPLSRTTTPARARITTTERYSWSAFDYTTGAPSLDSRFTGARTTSDCQTIADGVKREVGLGSCSLLRSGIKCLIRVTGVYKVTDSSLRRRLQNLVDSAESTYGIHCTEDAGILLQEVRQEQGFNSGARLGINVVVSLTLTISAMFSRFLAVH